jgi:hypothetical protein
MMAGFTINNSFNYEENTMNADAIFCRTFLKMTMVEVRKHVSKQDIKDAWTYDYKDSTGNMEFHGPNGYYHYGRYSNLWACRAHGWRAYLDSKFGIDTRQYLRGSLAIPW